MKMKWPLAIVATFFLLSPSLLQAQYTYKIKADSVRITNDSCNAELILENSTRKIKGFLYNKGNGRTEFRKGMLKLNDSLYVFGDDTLNVSSVLRNNTNNNSSGNGNYIWNQFSAPQPANAWVGGQLQIGTAATYPANSALRINKGSSQYFFSEGNGNQTPTLTLVNTNSTGRAAALAVGTIGSSFSFDNGGYFAIATEPKSSFTSGTLGNGNVLVKTFPNGNTIIGNNEVITPDPGYKLDVKGTGSFKDYINIQPSTTDNTWGLKIGASTSGSEEGFLEWKKPAGGNWKLGGRDNFSVMANGNMQWRAGYYNSNPNGRYWGASLSSEGFVISDGFYAADHTAFAIKNYTTTRDDGIILKVLSNGALYLAQSTTDLTGSKGAMYFNSAANRWKGNIDGNSWKNFLMEGDAASGNIANAQIMYGIGSNAYAGNNNFSYDAASGQVTISPLINTDIGLLTIRGSASTNFDRRIQLRIVDDHSSIVQTRRNTATGASGIYYEPHTSLSVTNPMWVSGLWGNGSDFKLMTYDGMNVISRLQVDTSGKLLVGFTASQGNYIGQFNGNVLANGLKLNGQTIDPTGSNGEIFYNSSTNTFKGYRNGTWKNFLMDGDAAPVSNSPNYIQNLQDTNSPQNANINMDGYAIIKKKAAIGANSNNAPALRIDATAPLNKGIISYDREDLIRGPRMLYMNANMPDYNGVGFAKVEGEQYWLYGKLFEVDVKPQHAYQGLTGYKASIQRNQPVDITALNTNKIVGFEADIEGYNGIAYGVYAKAKSSNGGAAYSIYADSGNVFIREKLILDRVKAPVGQTYQLIINDQGIISSQLINNETASGIQNIKRTVLTTTTTLTAEHYYIAADANSGAFSIQLPDAATCTNRVYKVKKVDTSSNSVTIDANGSQTIDGQQTLPLSTQWQVITIVSNGNSWEII